MNLKDLDIHLKNFDSMEYNSLKILNALSLSQEKIFMISFLLYSTFSFFTIFITIILFIHNKNIDYQFVSILQILVEIPPEIKHSLKFANHSNKHIRHFLSHVHQALPKLFHH